MQEDGIKRKIGELILALKAEGLWKAQEPFWVSQYRTNDEISGVDFFEWLQFVYLPNRMLNRLRLLPERHDNYITLQARKFAGDMMNERIMQLLVELDSL